MLDDEFLLNFIKEKCKELGITGYEIAKNTSISEQSAYKILDGTTENPRRKNLIQIYEYLESKVLGTGKQNMVEEPKDDYLKNTKDDYLEMFDKLQKEHIALIKEKHRLELLLEKHGIKY